MRLLVGFSLVLTMCCPLARAGEDSPQDRGLDPEALARIILDDDGPQQVLVAQAMRDADTNTILRVNQAVRKLAPEIAKEAAARAPMPDLSAAGDAPLHLVNVEVRFLDADGDFLRDVGVDMGGKGRRQPDPAAAGAAVVSYLDDVELEIMLRAVEKSTRVVQMSAPRLTVYDGQRANVSILDEKRFVADVERVESGEGTVAVRPVVQVAQEGVVLGIRPTLSADRRCITMELALLMAELIEIDAPRSIVCGGETIKLTMPKTQLHHMRSTFRIPDEGSVLINQGVTSGGRRRLVIITARHVEMSAKDLRDAVGEVPGSGEGKPEGK